MNLRNFVTQLALTLRNGRTFIMVGLAGLFFAFACPFQSYGHYNFIERFVLWLPPFTVAFLMIFISHGIVVHGLGVRNLIGERITTYFVFTFLFSPLLYGYFKFGPMINQATEVSFWLVGSWVLLTAGLGTWAFAIMNPERVMPIVPDKVSEVRPERPRLLRRLDLDEDDVAIIRLTVNDHYVVVGMSDGTEHRLLMRLTDAIAEMDEVQGFITHRSHWVSQTHVVGVVYEGKREMLELITGICVPISRTYRPVLVEAGLIPAVKEQREAPLEPKSHLA